MDLAKLIEILIRNGHFLRVANNPLAQFGKSQQPLLGASLLPELSRADNQYTEEGIRYRSVIANDGTRYSPVQLKRGMLIGQFDVKLVDSDIGAEMTGADYDALIRLVKEATATAENINNAGMAAMAAITNWANETLMWPLRYLDEKRRWEAIVDAQVTRSGDNGFSETLSYSNPSGHRFSSSLDWTDDADDPYDEIIAAVELLRNKGYVVSRIIAGTPVISALTLNEKIRTRVGVTSIISGNVVGLAGRANLDQINAALSKDGIPPIERYDGTYNTQTGSDYYLDRNSMVFIATTGRDFQIDLPDSDPLLVQNTIGYTGIGRATGQLSSGRVMKIKSIDDSKPPRIEGEAWQTSLPVILDPEAIAVIKDIVTT